VCGNAPHGGERGCGLYFCGAHLSAFGQLCERCDSEQDSFEKTPDLEEWLEHKATDPSWAEWREEQRAAVTDKTKAGEDASAP